MPALLDDQREVLAWLADPASYAERPERVERIDTHSATVVLAGSRAYKLKRAVRYSFLDFSSLEARRIACEAEVRLNRRTAPRLYLGTVPVTRGASGRLAFGGDGVPVEWLVVMRRFPQDRLLDRLAQAGPLPSSLVTSLAEAVAGFHRLAAPTPHRGGRRGTQEVVDDNAVSLAAAAGSDLPAGRVQLVNDACSHLVRQHTARLESRRAGGFVRQCHGDLHLGNIVVLDGQPTLFDAIEFNDDFACIDVWYDTAFLLMDLVARSHPREANGVFNRYLLRTSDVGGLPLLPLFLACRAAVRAKTSLASLALGEDAERRAALRERAREYLELAEGVLAPPPRMLVAIGGLSGSGKSTVAAALAASLRPAPGAVVVRTDELRKVLLHREPTERLGADGYTAVVTEDVYRAALLRATDVLRAGWPVIVDATFQDPAQRLAVAEAARQVGAAFHGVWLEAAPDELRSRLQARRGDASDADVSVLAQQMSRGAGEVAWPRLASSGPVEDVARQVRSLVVGA